MSKVGIRILLVNLSALAVLAGCGGPSAPVEDPMTGDFDAALGVEQAPPDLKIGETLFVNTDRLRVRSTPEIQDDNIVDVLAQADAVVVRRILSADSHFVGVTVPSLGHSQLVYVGRAYLQRVRTQSSGDLFIIQNIASEVTRVYRRCSGDLCAHELLLETENVVGDNTREMRTLLGSFKITRWFKFYEDGESRYPSWYHPDYTFPPLPSASASAWFDRTFMPRGQGEIRGGFGWYAAYIGPDASAQWIHGTYGWGANKKTFIQKTRSHGCTRLDNESVAYLRHLIKIGTPVLRVYAREALKTDIPQKTSSFWSYVLTKDDAQSSVNYDSDRNEVLLRKIPQSRWLEEGTYEIDTNASPVSLNSESKDSESTIHNNGNSYQIAEQSMRGVFWVDQGRLENYQHPQELDTGGYHDQLVPNSMIWKTK
jgi:hypothetical protein